MAPKKVKKQEKKGLSVLIVAKQNKAGLKAVRKLEKMLRKYTDNVHFDRSTAFQLRKMGSPIKKFRGEFIITLGGDGTFLLASHNANPNIPVLPVRLEGKGFLCTCDFDQLGDKLDNLFKKKFTVIEKIRLKCSKLPDGGLLEKIHRKSYPLALNEITFGRKRPSKLLDVMVKINETEFRMMGDGVIFSTPSGSTAYSASAGGSIIDPDLDVISIIPLYPFYSKIKPFVVPANKKIEVTVRGGDCALIIDGHGGDYFKRDSRFLIEKAKPEKIIVLDTQDFYHRINKNLFLG